DRGVADHADQLSQRLSSVPVEQTAHRACYPVPVVSIASVREYTGGDGPPCAAHTVLAHRADWIIDAKALLEEERGIDDREPGHCADQHGRRRNHERTRRRDRD